MVNVICIPWLWFPVSFILIHRLRLSRLNYLHILILVRHRQNVQRKVRDFRGRRFAEFAQGSILTASKPRTKNDLPNFIPVHHQANVPKRTFYRYYSGDAG
jgi:hypothetical protein